MKHRKDQRRIELARRLQAVGVPLEVDGDDRERGLVMRQFGEELGSHAFSTKYGETGYAVCMSMTFVLPGLAISSIDLELPWSDPSISLLEDPRETGNPYGEYCFPDGTSYGFHRSAVINHYVDVTRMRSPGETLQGFLLWTGKNPIPDDWPLWKKIPAFVVVYDQFDVPHRYPVTLYDTRTKKSLPLEQRKSTRKPLFECRDPKPATFKKDKVQDQEETVRTK
jgi:hypothetical protein